MPNKEPIFVKYDAETRKWFNRNPGAQTTVTCCEDCGLWYKPMLGHKCKVKKKTMKYYIGECGSSGRQFDNWDDFVKALKDLADTYAENGEDWFEIEVVND